MRRIRTIVKFDKRISLADKKLLIPENNTVGLIMHRIRERYIHESVTNSSTAIFILFSTDLEQRMFPTNATMGEISNSLGSPTMIQIDVAIENTFGCS